jgi:hypothetical protein
VKRWNPSLCTLKDFSLSFRKEYDGFDNHDNLHLARQERTQARKNSGKKELRQERTQARKNSGKKELRQERTQARKNSGKRGSTNG